MKKYLGSLIFFLLAMPVVAGTVRIYVSNQNSGSISVIDPVTNKVVQTIEGMTSPDGAVFSPDKSRAYIPDQDEHVLNVVDTKTGKSIKKIPLSGMPNLPAITKDGKRVLVAIWGVGDVGDNKALEPGSENKGFSIPKGAIDVVDTATLEKVKTIPMKGPMHDMFITPDGKFAVAGSPKARLMSVIDLKTEEPAWEVIFDTAGLHPSSDAGGPLTFTIEAGPGGSTSRIFLELVGLNGFSVVDFEKRKEVSRVQLPDAAFGYENEPTHGTGISPDGKTLWVCSRGTNYVYNYSLPDLKLERKLYMPELSAPGALGKSSDPHWITFTPDGKRAYIPLVTFGAVAAIDTKTLKEVARIPVAENPRHVAMLELP